MKKIIYRILVVLALLLPLFMVFIVLLFFWIIQDYVYLKINNDNKEDIISLLQEQEEITELNNLVPIRTSNLYWRNK